MRKLFLITALMLTTLALSAQGAKYTITGSTVQIPEAEGKTVYLSDYNENNVVDSAVVKNAKFVFSGEVADPAVFRVDMGQLASADVVIEAGAITIDMIAAENWLQANAYGTQLNEKMSDVNDIMNQLIVKSQEFENDSILTDQEKEQFFKEKFEQYMQEQFALFSDNKDNRVGAYVLWKINDYIPMGQSDSLLATAGAAVHEYGPIKEMVQNHDKVRATSPGKQFMDFDAKKTDNTTSVKFSDYVAKGKWLLADFWASWCGPCMEELPNIKKIHETLGEKVTVIGVNVWDKPEKCVESITKKEMTWESIIVSDRSATDAYGIRGIPTIILFAPDGTIVSRELRGEDMADKIAEIIAEYKK